MNVKYIDIHSHISPRDYENDIEEVIQRMKDKGVATIVIGVDLESSQEAVVLAEKHENIFACIGAHPRDTEGFIFEEDDFKELVQNPKVVAIGECGLDYFKFDGNLEIEKFRQKKEFIKQIEFAIKYNKPLMMHIRDAHDDAYEILSKYQGKAKGNLHFFTGTSSLAKKFIDLGFTVSFPGVITFAKETEEAVKNIPLEVMHAETDSPYAAPIPYRGKRNEPTYVVEVVKKIAEIRGDEEEKVRSQLLKNAKGMFGLKF
jgi:TatD DNase family protein